MTLHYLDDHFSRWIILDDVYDLDEMPSRHVARLPPNLTNNRRASYWRSGKISAPNDKLQPYNFTRLQIEKRRLLAADNLQISQNTKKKFSNDDAFKSTKLSAQ